MSRGFAWALGVSAGLHAALLAGAPWVTEPVQYDVERAVTSVELFLAPPVPPAAVPAPDAPAIEPAAAPTVAVPDIPRETAAMDEARGADLASPPKYVRNPAPVYPRAARECGYEGTVVLEVEVLASGRCGSLRVLASSGYSILDEAAAQAVRGWTFRPARRWRTPVAFTVEIPVRFRLIDAESLR